MPDKEPLVGAKNPYDPEGPMGEKAVLRRNNERDLAPLKYEKTKPAPTGNESRFISTVKKMKYQ